MVPESFAVVLTGDFYRDTLDLGFILFYIQEFFMVRSNDRQSRMIE